MADPVTGPYVQCEVIDHRGAVHGPFKNMERAAAFARRRIDLVHRL